MSGTSDKTAGRNALAWGLPLPQQRASCQQSVLCSGGHPGLHQERLLSPRGERGREPRDGVHLGQGKGGQRRMGDSGELKVYLLLL